MADQARFRKFRERYLANELIVGMTCSTMSPVMTEIIGYAGFDFVIVDTEMLSINPETVESMVRAAECSGTIPIIKLKDNEPHQIADALNTGAPIVKIPHAKHPDDLKRAKDAAYFHPKGHRGLCTVARANRYAQGRMSELVEWTNREAQVVAIIEDKEAMARIDELMAVDGIEIYEFGPVDMSHSFGLPPDRGLANAEISAALDRALEAAKKYNKHILTVPIFGPDIAATPEMVKEKLIDRGVHMIFYRPDSVAMRAVTQDTLRVRSLVAGR